MSKQNNFNKDFEMFKKKAYTYRPKIGFKSIEELKRELLLHPDVAGVEVKTWSEVRGITNMVVKK